MASAWTGVVPSSLTPWTLQLKESALAAGAAIDPRYKHTAYVFNEHHGHWSRDGIWYSNTSYVWRGPSTDEQPETHGTTTATTADSTGSSSSARTARPAVLRTMLARIPAL